MEYKIAVNFAMPHMPATGVSGHDLPGLYPRRDMEKRISGLNKRIAALKIKSSVIYINPGTVLLKQNGLIDETLFTDGLHPNEKGYEKLGVAISRVLKWTDHKMADSN